MDRKYQIYISHFPSHFTERKLERIFEGYGTILSTSIKENQNGALFAFMVIISNAILNFFGFQSFKHNDERINAISSMNGHWVENHRLVVQLPNNEIRFCSICGKKNHLFSSNLFEKLNLVFQAQRLPSEQISQEKNFKFERKVKTIKRISSRFFFRFTRRSRSRSRSKSFKKHHHRHHSKRQKSFKSSDLNIFFFIQLLFP